MPNVDTPECDNSRVPNQPKTPLRNLRVSNRLWLAAREAAAERDETLSDVMRRALADYAGVPLEEPPDEGPSRVDVSTPEPNRVALNRAESD